MAERILIQDTVSDVYYDEGYIGKLSISLSDYVNALNDYVSDYSMVKVELVGLDYYTTNGIIGLSVVSNNYVSFDFPFYEGGSEMGYYNVIIDNYTGHIRINDGNLENGWTLKLYVEEEEEKFLDKVGFTHLWNNLKAYFQDKLISGTNIKTINNESLLGDGNIDIQGSGTVDNAMSDTSENAVQNKVIKSYVDSSVTINKIKLGNAELPITNKAVTIPNYIYAITKTQYSLQAHNVNGVHDNSLTISKVSGKDRLKFLAWDNTQQEVVFDIDVPNANELGDLSLLTTDDKTSLVNALNEVYEKSGEPFRVKQWGSSWADGITIPVITKDISNTQIPKMVFSIDAEEGASYQIVGMIAYEVFDAVSGGNRVNVFPVCQFTGNGQKELSVRFMCAGTQDKVAKRINAWVLLKHR